MKETKQQIRKEEYISTQEQQYNQAVVAITVVLGEVVIMVKR